MNLTLQKSNLAQAAVNRKKHDLIPDFLIIGAGKSGTTSLDKYLRQHPEIFVPKDKEPNFFGYENTKVEDLNGDIDEILHFNTSVTNFEDYINLFRNAQPDQVKGENSNTYMYHTQAPERIKYYNPDMKLIAILRQPAGRLYSRFLHLARDRRAPTENFADCRDKTSVWWKRDDLIKEGFYYKNLLPFFKLFPKQNIRVYLFEDLNERPGEILRDVYRFLGVNEDFKTDLTIRFNQSGLVKNKFLDKLYGHHGLIGRILKTLLPYSTVRKLRDTKIIQRIVNTLRGKNLVKPKMDPQIRRWLTRDVYGDDIRKLQQLIGKDLSHWLKA